MKSRILRKTAMVAVVMAIFGSGFFAGSIYTRNAIALELGGLGSTIDSLKSLGKTVIEMQKNVDELQQNINDVKKVKDDISTYQGVYNKVTGTEQPAAAPAQQQGVSPTLQKGVIDLLNK